MMMVVKMIIGAWTMMVAKMMTRAARITAMKTKRAVATWQGGAMMFCGARARTLE